MLRVYAHLKGIDRLDSERLADYRACGVGKWYYGEEGQKYRDLPGFMEFEEAHRACHNIGRDIIVAYNSGDYDKVNKLKKEIERNNEKLNKILDQLKSGYLARIR
jgi:methyl-accepting chemotaxis protein